jgi:hypothetical protein
MCLDQRSRLPAVAYVRQQSPAKERIHALARAHGVIYRPNALDDLGNTYARLSGDDVQLDDTQLLLLVLARAGHVSNEEADDLHVAYLKERAS